MQHQLNIRLVFWSIAVCIMLGTIVHFVHDFQVRRNADGVLLQARNAQKKGDTEKALNFYNHYLSFRPEDTPALAEFGLLLDSYAKTPADTGQAIRVLDNVVRRDKDNKEARLRLAQRLVGLVRIESINQAITHLEQLEKQDWNRKSEVKHLLGWCYEARKDYEPAKQKLYEAIALNLGNLDSYMLLSEIHQNLEEQDHAEKMMDRMVENNPEQFRAYLIRSKFLLKNKDLEGSEKDLRKAQSLAPNEPAVLLSAAEWSLGKGQLQEARKHLEEGLKEHPEHAGLVKALAGIEMRADRREQAQKVLREGLSKQPLAWDLLVLLTDLLIDDDKLDDAERKLAELRRMQAPTPLVDYLQARLQIERGQWSESVALLEKVRVDLGTHSEWGGRINALLGLCYEQTGDTEQQLASFRRAVDQEPSWTAARFGKGAALLATGRVEDALTELTDIASNPDAPASVHAVLARSLVLKNLRLPDSKREWGPVELALNQAQKAMPDSFEVPILRAEMLAAQKKVSEAKTILEKAREKNPKQVAFACALADLAARQKDYTGALAILDDAKKNLGDSLELRLARCQLAALRSNREAKADLEMLGQNLGGLEPEARIKLLRELADTWNRIGEYSRAEDLWKLIAKDQTRDLRSRFLLLELALAANQLEQARILVSEIKKIEGELGTLWRYSQAAVQVADARGDSKRLEAARAQVEQLLKKQGDWARLPLLRARIYELEGKPDLALRDYQRSFELGERQPRMVLKLVRMLLEQRLYGEAESVVRKVEEGRPLPRDLAKLGAEAALALGDKDRTLSLANRAVPDELRDFRDLVWLANIHSNLGDPDEAEKLLRQAIALAGHTPEPWVALTDHFARLGQHAKAEKLLAEAKEKIPADRLPLTLARAYETLGLFDQAEAQFLEALAKKPQDFIALTQLADFYRRSDQFTKAEPILRRLLEPQTAAPGEHLAQARRWLAILLSRSGNLLDQQLATDLLNANLKQRGETLPDKRARAIVQGSQPEKRMQAIQAFEETRAFQPPTPDELLLLAQLHEAGEDYANARNILLDLVTLQPDAPQFLAEYVRVLLKEGELADAATYLTRLERREPTSVRVKQLRVALEKAKS